MHACTAIRNSDRMVAFGGGLEFLRRRQLYELFCKAIIVGQDVAVRVWSGTPGLSPSDLVFSCYLNAYLGLVDPTWIPSRFCPAQTRDSMHVIEQGVRYQVPREHLPCSRIVGRALVYVESYCERGW